MYNCNWIYYFTWKYLCLPQPQRRKERPYYAFVCLSNTILLYRTYISLFSLCCIVFFMVHFWKGIKNMLVPNLNLAQMICWRYSCLVGNLWRWCLFSCFVVCLMLLASPSYTVQCAFVEKVEQHTKALIFISTKIAIFMTTGAFSL